MKFFDSHAHLDDEKFNEDREFLIKSLKEAEITKCISAGYSLEVSQKAINLAKQYEFIYAACGIAPSDIPQTEDELWKDIAKIEKIVKENQTEKKKIVVAIGEIGLDYYWEKDEERRNMQKKAFIEQIKLANQLELPIVIHTRDAIMDTIEILKNNEVKHKGVFHCCPQNR